MTSPVTPRLAYDELASPAELAADARATGTRLNLEQVARRARRGAPSLAYDDFPREVAKRDVRVDEAAARLAAALYDA